MAMALSFPTSQLTRLSLFPFPKPFHHSTQFLLLSPSISIRNPRTTYPLLPICFAARSQTGPVKKQSPSSAGNSSKKKKKKTSKTKPDTLRDVEIVKGDVEIVKDAVVVESDDISDSDSGYGSSSLSYHPTTPLPKPPAGFVVDETGRVLLASDKRIATIVDSSNNCQLECIIRRVFRTSQGAECMLLCPVDTPVQILKSTNIDGWSAVSDDEVESILPAAAYALAKIHMHLVHSGFCYTARGGFCYSEDDIFDFRTVADDGQESQDIEGLPTEGVEITCFHLDGAHYMIYTPSDPLMFVAVKDQKGQLQIADDDLLDDPAVMSAIDEETEFNALVEEEEALLESLMGER